MFEHLGLTFPWHSYIVEFQPNGQPKSDHRAKLSTHFLDHHWNTTHSSWHHGLQRQNENFSSTGGSAGKLKIRFIYFLEGMPHKWNE